MHTSKDPGQGKANDAVEIGDEIMSEVASNLGSPVTQEENADDADDGGEEDDKGSDAGEDAAEADDNGSEGDDTEDGDEDESEETESEENADEEDAAEDDSEEENAEDADKQEDGDEDAEEKDGAADKAAAGKKLSTALKGATKEQIAAAQAVIDGIIDDVVVKGRKESERLGARVTELTTELEREKKAKGPAIVGSVNPLFLVDDEEEIADRESKIADFERWARKAIRAGGENMPETEGYDPKKPSYTVDQIEDRLEQLQEEKNKLIPAARANLLKRAAIDKTLRKIYPAIFDPKSAEYAQVQQVFKALPELKQFADARVIALKQILGDRALADLLKKQKKESSPTGQHKKPKGSTPPPKKSPPRAPGGGAPAKGSVLDPKSKQTGAPEAVKKVMQNPGDKKAFSSAVAALVADL